MADLVLEQQLISLDQLLAMSSKTRIEIVDGEIVPMAGGGVTHGIIGGNIFNPIYLYLETDDLGVVLPDGVTFLMHSPLKGLKDSFEPDVGFIYHSNFPDGWEAEKPHPGVPDLAVEIVSPGDDAAMVQRKRLTYLDKGTQQVWLVYPRLREVHQYSQTGVVIYSGVMAVDVSALFPKMSPLSLDQIFKLPKWAK